MTFLFDENLSPRIAEGLKAFGFPVVYVTEVLGRGATDEEIFRLLSQRGWLLVTHDRKIHAKHAQRAAMLGAGVGAFVFTAALNKMGFHEQALLIHRMMSEIQALAAKTSPPFIFAIPRKGKIRRLDRPGK